MAKRSTIGRGPRDREIALGAGGRRLTLLGYGACALAACLWGTGFYWGRLALNEMSVEHMVLYRFLFAWLAMLPVVVANRKRFHLTASELRLLLFAPPSACPSSFSSNFMDWP